MESLWIQTAHLPQFQKLEQDTETDVLVIGGGIAGILTAYTLQKSGIKCILVEKDRVCRGVSAGTTAKITSQHGLSYAKLIRRFGKEKAGLYLAANEEAIGRYRALAGEIDCDFRETDAYLYARFQRRALIEEQDALKRLGYSAELLDRAELPFRVAGVLRFREQGIFHPLKFLAGLLEGLTVYEKTQAEEIRKGPKGFLVSAGGKTVSAKRVVVATHFPYLNRHGFYFLKLYQSRSYLIAYENLPIPDGIYLGIGEKEGVPVSWNSLSFRPVGDRVLIGGGGHRTGKNGKCYGAIESFVRKYYPDAREVCRFATQDCMPLDGVPYIGQYAATTPGLYVATGFGKWGMTSSMVAAHLLTDLIQGKENRYAALFSPSRSILRKQLFLNAGEAGANLLTFTGKRCPHLGCALKWNPVEHTYDCPCHGSRFAEDGTLLDNPATGDLKDRS